MEIEGGCYCGAVRYKVEGDPLFKGQCHCRECQYISGGSANVLMVVPKDSFRYTQGEPASFARSDLEEPVTREFCGNCGTPLTSLPPGMADVVVVKVGSLDDVSAYGTPDMAIFCCDKQAFHHVPEGMPAFDRMPG